MSELEDNLQVIKNEIPQFSGKAYKRVKDSPAYKAGFIDGQSTLEQQNEKLLGLVREAIEIDKPARMRTPGMHEWINKAQQTLAELEARERDFNDKHSKDRVFLVICVHAKSDRYAIFSTHEKADKYMSEQDAPCVAVPFIIDEPDFGYIPIGKSN